MENIYLAILTELEKKPRTPESFYKMFETKPKKLLEYQNAFKSLSNRQMITYGGLYSDMRITQKGLDCLDRMLLSEKSRIAEKRRYVINTILSSAAILISLIALFK